MVHAVTDTSRNTHDHGENQAETEDPKQSIAIDDQLPTTQTSALDQNFSLLSITGIALTTGESWIVVGNSLVLAIYNGGAPGVLYAFVADSVFYWIVAASVAELASSLPSAGSVYHWATITGGRYGRITGWYAGWWNFFAWTVGVASLVSFMALQLVSIWGTLHPEFVVHEWHIFCAYLASTWTTCVIVLFFNKILPFIESTGTFFIVAGWLISIIVCICMPYVNGRPYATTTAVWTDWQNTTGYSSNGFVFLLGMLNAAFAVCAPDIPSHLAEEIPNPKRNVPMAILAQYVAAFVTGFCYLITLFYATPDLAAIIASDSIFPLSLIYLQATNRAATAGLLVLALIPTFIGTIGGFTIAGRQGYALARDKATPFHTFFAHLTKSGNSPANATGVVGIFVTALGCIYLGSARAFNDIAGCFVVLTSLSYLAAIVPHVLSRRKNIRPGPFWMPGWIGYAVNTISILYLSCFGVIFMFPASLPVSSANMNYTSVIVGGVTILVSIWWFFKCKDYQGPTDLMAV